MTPERYRHYATKTKYGATKVTFDGHTFDSKKEGYHYLRLKELLSSGKITNLRMQVPYVLIPKQVDNATLPQRKQKVLERECVYKADFVYEDEEKHTHVVDTKGMKTPEYRIKKKLMLYVHGIRIEEI